MEEMQRMGLDDLPVVQQAAQLLRRRRQRAVAGDEVHRLGRRERWLTGQMPHRRCTTTGTSQYGRPRMKTSKPRNSTMWSRT